MGVSIPDIDVDQIGDRKLAEQIKQLLHVVEFLFAENERLKKENRQLRDEIAKLKQQPKLPKFSSSVDYSATKRDQKEKKEWHKGKKRDTIHIDQVVQLSEVDVCTCGSHEFLIQRTVEKLIQDMVITTNNILYQGRDKKCKQCGKLYQAAILESLKGVQFGNVLRS